MSISTRGLLVAVALVTAACTSPMRFDNDGVVDLNATGQGQGGVDDPASPAYFQQAIGDRVFFVVDTSTLTAEGRSVLDGQATWLSANSDYNAVIEGHADEQGTREYNLALGARRASAVRDYLVTKGISADRMRTVSYGKERPVEICSEESCYAKNRRAVTIISAGFAG